VVITVPGYAAPRSNADAEFGFVTWAILVFACSESTCQGCWKIRAFSAADQGDFCPFHDCSTNWQSRTKPQPDITTLLGLAGGGDRRAQEELFRLVEAQLRRRAQACLRRERSGHDL
jgi:hypothetical protein